MPRYFFNTRIDGELIRDPDGAELRDPDHAWTMARAMIRDILHDEEAEPRLMRAAIEVTDEDFIPENLETVGSLVQFVLRKRGLLT